MLAPRLDEFVHWLGQSGLPPVDTAVLESGPERVGVSGLFLEGGSTDPGFRATLESDSISGTPRVIRFVLTSTRRSLATTGQLFFHAYRAAIAMPRGDYRLQVVHARAKTYVSYDAPGARRTVVVDTVLTVP